MRLLIGKHLKFYDDPNENQWVANFFAIIAFTFSLTMTHIVFHTNDISKLWFLLPFTLYSWIINLNNSPFYSFVSFVSKTSRNLIDDYNESQDKNN